MASAQHDICAICLEQPKTPKSLPTCTHLFCEACLNSYVRRQQAEESVACPTCTIACPMQDIKAPDDLEPPTEPTKNDLLCTFCSYKGLEAKAEFYCDSCDHGEDVFLCPDCASSHGKKARFQSHDANPLTVFVRLARCKSHGGRVMKFLCIGCDTPACEVCADVDHDDHELVDIRDLKKQLHDHVDSLQDDAKHIPSLERERLDIQTAEEDAITMVEQQAELIKQDFVSRVDTRRDELLSAVRERSQTRGNQLCVEMSGISDELQESLKHGREILARDISNTEQYRCALSTEERLAKIRSKAGTAIFGFERKLWDAPAPRFIPKEGDIVGEIEYLQRIKTGTVRLELGGKYARKPCYKIGPAVPFLGEDSLNQVLLSQLAFLEKCNEKWSLQMTEPDKELTSTWNCHDTVIDMITDNNGEISVVYCNSSGNFCIQPMKQNVLWPGNSPKRLYDLDKNNVKSFTQTRSWQYAILSTQSYNSTTVLVLDVNYQKVWDPITVEAAGIPNDCVKILCPESTDLLLIHGKKGDKVSAISLEVRQDSMSGESVGGLQRFFATRSPILPPVEGFFILDISCDGGKVYMCIKKGAYTGWSPAAGPIQFYQATYTNDKWQYTVIPLEDPTGKPFSELKKDELLKLGAYKGTVMCLVCSPIPLAELKESKEPGMNVTWYHGKLP